MIPEITGLYAGVLALSLVYLALRVATLRNKYKVGTGSGENEELDVAVRCHGNACEYIPVALILLLIAELNGVDAAFLHSAGIAFIVGRVLHAWGLTKTQGGKSFGRLVGTLMTWAVIVVLASVCIYFSF